MNEHIIQVYGVHPWGDFLGTLTALGIYAFLKTLGTSDKGLKWYWIINMSYSGWGSLAVLARALYWLDPVTIVYHLAWVAFSAWFIAKIYKPTWAETLNKWDGWETRLVERAYDFTHRGKAGDHERL